MRRGMRFVVMLGAGALGLSISCATSYSDATPPPDAGDAESTLTDAASAPTGDALPSEASTSDASALGFASTLIQVSGGGSLFEIEATEVTVAQYNLFKTQLSLPLAFPAEKCPSKTALGPPAGHCGARFQDDDPVTCVDWCDADAYCKAIGRHLCGNKSGSTLAEASLNDPAVDEWYFACSGPAALQYPYGTMDEPSYCATAERIGQIANVASISTCQGAESGLFDMSGNAAEWVDSCEGAVCILRGGSYEDPAGNASCTIRTAASATTPFADVGFRCCTEP